MSNCKEQLRAVMRYLAAETQEEQELARAELRQMLHSDALTPARDAEMEIRKALLELGVPDRLLGYDYLTFAIGAVIHDTSYRNRAARGLYPQTAQAFHTTVANAERLIRHAIEVAWHRVDLNAMVAYFGNTVSPDRGKPTNTEFIARVANVVRQRLQTK